MKIDRVAILGGGALSEALLTNTLKGVHRVYVLSKPDYNIVGDQDKMMEFFKENKIDMVINTAAKTDVDWCQENVKRAFNVNMGAPLKLYQRIIETPGCPVKWFVAFSSEMVFDGKSENKYTERDELSPVNVYGATKGGLESFLDAFYKDERNKKRRVKVRYTCIRTSWLYSKTFGFGTRFRGWPRSMIKLLNERKNIWVANDVVGCPTTYEDLAEFVALLIRCVRVNQGADLEPLTGVINVVGSRSVSRARWLDFIHDEYVGTGFEIGCKNIVDLPYEQYLSYSKEPAYRPLNGRLDNSLAKSMGWSPMLWKYVTGNYVHQACTLMKAVDEHRRAGHLAKNTQINW